MIIKLIGLLVLALFGVLNLYGQQQPVCDVGSEYLIDSRWPSVFLEFERFGKWKPTVGSDGEPTIEKGSEVWLRLRNNSCWKIKFEGWLDGDGTTLVGKTFYTAVEGNGKYIPQNYGDTSVVSTLPPGSSLLFPVRKIHLRDGHSIYVKFEYGWEGLSVLNPEHRAYFRRNLEDLQTK